MKRRHRLLLTSAAMVCAACAVTTSQAAELVAHFEFEDAENLGLDSSGMDNHAEVSDVEQVEGPFGQGGFFDETLPSSFVVLDGLNGFTGKPGVTLAAWVKLDEATTGFDGIISQDPGGCCQNRILLHPDHNVFINLSEHNDRHLTGGPAVEFDEWTHIAMVGEDVDGFAEARVFVNGVEVDDSPQEFPEMDEGSDWSTYLGAGEGGTAHRLTGALDDVRIYEGALTEEEIMELLNGPSGGDSALIIEEGVVGNQAFEGALGMDFVVNFPIEVGQLGAFDSESDELLRPITVELWSRDDGGTPDTFDDDSGGEILTSLEFEEDAGTLEGGTRFLPLDEAVSLAPGAYTIVGWGYGAEEQNYNVGGRDAAAEGLTITEAQSITFVGGSRFGDPANNGQWPTSPDGGPENRYGAGNFKFTRGGDSCDDDGIPDFWEEANGLDPCEAADGTQDPDGDTLTNLQEFEKGTNPKKDDTDGDGLKDNVETNTGTWVGAADTGTSPTKPDSDGDGLRDNVETNTKTYVSASDTGTNPNLRDSDGDGTGDGVEVNDPNRDPNNPNDTPASALVAHYEFEDPNNLGLDSSGMDNHAEVSDVEQVEGQFGQGGFFDETLPSSFVVLDGLNGFTGKPGVTLAAWVKLDEATTGFDGIISQDPGGCCQNRILLHPDHNVFINLSEHNDRHLTGGPAVEFDEWTHIAMVGEDVDGFAEARVFVNGVEVDDSPQEFPEMDDGSAWNTYLGAGESGNVHLLTGALDDVRIYQGALTEEEIMELLNPAPSVFEITQITKMENELILQWTSGPGRIYAVEITTDLANSEWIELDDGVESEGALTEFTDDDAERLGLPEAYYRIREN